MPHEHCCILAEPNLRDLQVAQKRRVSEHVLKITHPVHPEWLALIEARGD
jgi:hypothetical protein